MEGLPVLIFILFAVMSLMEKVLKKPPPPGSGGPQRPGQRLPQGGTRRPQRTSLPGTRERGGAPSPPRGSSADDMIPDDLWLILTGETRPRPGPIPPPDEPEDLPSWDEAAVAHVEAAPDEETSVPEERSLETYRREIVVHERPRVVSMETPPLPPEQRHAAYHARLESTRSPLAGIETKSPAAALHQRFRSSASLRDALIVAEVLGKPKGLE
jgi:hypothetical protein